MEFYKITESLQANLEPKLKIVFSNRQFRFELNHYHSNRFVQLNTILPDNDIHYEYYQGYVELHLEGKYSRYESNTIWRQLVEKSYNYDNLSWHRWGNRNQGRCRYNYQNQTPDDIIAGFEYLSKIFDPILKPFADDSINKAELIEHIENNEILPEPKCMRVDEMVYGVKHVKDLPFDSFRIPEYQRPYKWSVKNVNQLINDLQTFRQNREYRLGTLVLHENYIVDGQQRIVTLSLLLYVLFNRQEIVSENLFQEVQDKIKTFWKRTKFRNEYSIAHVRENLSAIESRIEDLDSHFLEFLLNNCQFVVVQLPQISEAFQFFDSQNARGKDLEPHDLLKAFHLREIKSFSKNDSENITRWQEFSSDYLADLFLSLYRIKRWSKGNGGREFTKNDIDVFKGISLDAKRYPFYMQQIICHCFSNTYSNDIVRQIDKAKMEFPFQLDQTGINGSRFFDMIQHYANLYSRIVQCNEYLPYKTDNESKTAYNIIYELNHYNNRNRTGDIYVRQLFDCLLMYYIDRFGFEEINKVTKKIFMYVYRLRLMHFSIQLSTIDNEAVCGVMFKTIRDAQTPYDIINLSIPTLNEDSEDIARNADQQIKELYF